MTFHFPTPRRRQRQPQPRPRVVDESGFPADRELPPELRPAGHMRTRPAAPVDPAMLPAQQRELVTDTPLVSKTPLTWEERFGALWESIDGRLAKLAKYVADKSAFDDGQMVKWSEWMRGKRVNGDRDVDALLLQDQYAEGGTAVMADLQRQIRQRILADALAATS